MNRRNTSSTVKQFPKAKVKFYSKICGYFNKLHSVI